MENSVPSGINMHLLGLVKGFSHSKYLTLGHSKTRVNKILGYLYISHLS